MRTYVRLLWFTFDSFRQTIYVNSFIWRPKRLVILFKDCLLLFLSMSVFYLLVFLFLHFFVVGCVRLIKLTRVGFRAHVKIASRIVSYRSGLAGRAFQFGQKSFDSIRFDSRYRIDFFDSIRFASLINLPLLHWYSNSNDGEFGHGGLAKGLAASHYAVVHSVPCQYQLDNFQQVKNV